MVFTASHLFFNKKCRYVLSINTNISNSFRYTKHAASNILSGSLCKSNRKSQRHIGEPVQIQLKMSASYQGACANPTERVRAKSGSLCKSNRQSQRHIGKPVQIQQKESASYQGDCANPTERVSVISGSLCKSNKKCQRHIREPVQIQQTESASYWEACANPTERVSVISGRLCESNRKSQRHRLMYTLWVTSYLGLARIIYTCHIYIRGGQLSKYPEM